MFPHIITFGSSLPEARGGHSLCAIICERVLTVASSVDLAEIIRFHFGSLGYEQIYEERNEWIFHRGKRYAGLYATNVVELDTSLTVRAIQTRGEATVNCLWEVATMGAMIFRGDIKKLEAEGHELHAALQGKTPPQRSLSSEVTPAAPALAFEHSFDAVVSEDDKDVLEAARAELEGVSLSLIVLGVLAIVVYGFALFNLRWFPQGVTMPLFFASAAGSVLAVLMISGGFALRSLRPRTLAMVGAASALLLPSPLWLVTGIGGAFALNLLGRPHVRKGFRRAEELAQQRQRMSGKAVIGFCFSFLAILTFLLAMSVQQSVAQSDGPAIFQWVLRIVIGLPGLLSPVVTTVLGLWAFVDIRTARGRVTGLVLAFVDSVFYLILLLSLAIAWGFSLEGSVWSTGLQASVIFMVDCGIIWWLWRRAKAFVRS